MKRVVLTTALLIGMGIVSLSAQLKEITKIGVVDMNRIMNTFMDQEAAKAYTEKRNQIQAEIEKQNKELQELTAKHTETQEKLAEAQEQKNKEQIRSLENQIKTLENQIRTKTQAVRNYIETNYTALEKEREQILKNSNFDRERVIRAIRSVSEKEGITLVLEGADILWYSHSVDITNKVIAQIRGR